MFRGDVYKYVARDRDGRAPMLSCEEPWDIYPERWQGKDFRPQTSEFAKSSFGETHALWDSGNAVPKVRDPV